jgi:hypothetical protein
MGIEHIKFTQKKMFNSKSTSELRLELRLGLRLGLGLIGMLLTNIKFPKVSVTSNNYLSVSTFKLIRRDETHN